MTPRRKYKYCPECGSELSDKKIEGRKRKYCGKCGWINYLNPVPATASLLREKDKVLLVRRGIEPCRGKLALPGGYIELGESPETAALRELKEETGIEGEIEKLIGVYPQESPHYGTVLVVGYLIRRIGGKLSPGSDVTSAEFTHPEVDSIAFESQRLMLKEEGF